MRSPTHSKGFVIRTETEMTQTIMAVANRAGSPKEAAATPFHERASIQSLISPVSEEEYRARYWEKRPLIVHRNDLRPSYFGPVESSAAASAPGVSVRN